MRTSRLHTPLELAPGRTLDLDDRACHYAGQVLRLRQGQRLVLFNGDGDDYEAELTRLDRRGCTVRVLGVSAHEAPPTLALHLGIGISRGERMDFAIRKSVELGVHELAPLLTARSVVQLREDRLDRRMQHWQGILLSACEQSGRSRLPRLLAPAPLDDWLAAAPGGLMLYHEAASGLAGLPQPTSPLHLLIGPEGGLCARERARAAAAGFTAVRLGPRVLRTETAPLAALAAVQTLWGDFR